MNWTSMVGYQRRFVGTFEFAKRVLDQGVLGAPKTFRAHHFTAGVLQPGVGWRFKAESGGMILDWGAHLASILNWFFGEPESVLAVKRAVYSTEVEDFAAALLQYSDGLAGIFGAGWSMRGFSPPELLLEIEGELGSVRVTEDRVVLRVGVERTPEFPVGAHVRYVSELTSPLPYLYGPPEAVVQDLRFIGALGTTSQLPNSFEEGSRVQLFLDSLRRSGERES
jgi:predicted dehydrogenase